MNNNNPKKKYNFWKKILLYYWANNIKNYFGIYDIKNKGYISLAKKKYFLNICTETNSFWYIPNYYYIKNRT